MSPFTVRGPAHIQYNKAYNSPFFPKDSEDSTCVFNFTAYFSSRYVRDQY